MSGLPAVYDLEGWTVRERDKRFPDRKGTVIGWRRGKREGVQVEWNTGKVTWLSARNLHRYVVVEGQG